MTLNAKGINTSRHNSVGCIVIDLYIRSLTAQLQYVAINEKFVSIFIPRHTLVAGYYVFALSVRVSVCTSVRTLFPFDNLSIYIRISFKFCICICNNNVSLGIVNGQISIIYHRAMALVNVQKCLFGL